MPGTHELRLISRYFGGQATPATFSQLAVGTGVLGSGNKLAEEVCSAAAAGQHSHHLHVSPKADHSANKQPFSEEELMQVLFKKLKGSKFTGPTHQGDAHGQPGH